MSGRRAAIISVKSISALSQVASPSLTTQPRNHPFPCQSLADCLAPPALCKAVSGTAAEKVVFRQQNGNDHDPRSQANACGFAGDGHYDRQMGVVNSTGGHWNPPRQDSGDGGNFDDSRVRPTANSYGWQSLGGQGHHTSPGGYTATGYDPLLQSPDGYGRGTSQQSHSGYYYAAKHGQGYQSHSNGGGIADQGIGNSNEYSSNHPDGFGRETNRGVHYAANTGQEFGSYPSGHYVQNNAGVAPQRGLNSTGRYGPPSPSSAMQDPNSTNANARVATNAAFFQMGGNQHATTQIPYSGSNYQQNPYQPQSQSVGYNENAVGLRGDNVNGFNNMIWPRSEAVGSLFPNSALPEGDVAGADEPKFRGTIEELDDLCKQGKVEGAVEVLDMLEKQGTPIDLAKYYRLMQACGDATALKEAKAVCDHIMRISSQVDVRMYNKMIDMYAKCGSMDDAVQLFERMPARNMTTWDSVITGYAINGMGEEAIDAFTQFKQQGLNPDDQLFIGVFAACSVLNAVDEGMLHFESMIKTYNISPTMAHYVAIVELLGKSGHLDEALEFIEKMPLEPTVDVWEALMNLGRVYGNTELGKRCAEMVELLDPSRLTDQSKAGLVPVKASDIAKEKEKKSSGSLARSRMYEYRAGDTSHPEKDRIYENLKFLSAQMREAGYVPDTTCVLHDVDPESKEEALLYHSEKLALSYGLISSSVSSSIRIIKNLRICKDCHNALKIISNLAGREIICRDAKRFHHFRDGLCSCKDYW